MEPTIELRKPCKHDDIQCWSCGDEEVPSVAEVIQWLKEHDGINYEAAKSVPRYGSAHPPTDRRLKEERDRAVIDAALGGE